MATTIKNTKTAQLADALIAAAQELEKSARLLKDTARLARREGLTQWDDSQDVCESQREFKSHDIKNAAAKALVALGTLPEDGFLIGRSFTAQEEGR